MSLSFPFYCYHDVLRCRRLVGNLIKKETDLVVERWSI